MKTLPQVEKDLALLRQAITKIGLRQAARTLGGNHMTAARFVNGRADDHVNLFYRLAQVAGYQVKLIATQIPLPFPKGKKKGRHKSVTVTQVTAEPPPHLSRKDVLMVSKIIHARKAKK